MSDTSLLSFTWEECCHLLDSSPTDVRANQQAQTPPWLTSPGQYFFEFHPQKRALESLCLKLSLLRDICAQIAGEHEQARCARGTVDPEHVTVQFPERRVTILPARWSATVSLKEVGHQPQRLPDGMPPEMAASFTAIPVSTNFAYASPLVKDWSLGKKVSVTALIQSMDALPAEDETSVRGAIQIHAIAEGLRARDFSDQDVFRVSFPVGDRRSGRVEVWARKVGSPERGIVVSGTSSEMARSVWNQLAKTQAEVRSSAELVAYRAATPAHDVYSCGILLLRALLGPDARRWEQVCDLIPSISERLQPVVQGLDPDDLYTLQVQVKERVRGSTDLFEAGSLPEFLWWDAVVVVLRATSHIPGFSYAAGAVEYGPSPVRGLEQELESLARRARIELFEASERAVVLLRVSDQLLDELGTRV